MRLALLCALVASLAGGCGKSAAPTTTTPRPAGGLKDEPTFGKKPPAGNLD